MLLKGLMEVRDATRPIAALEMALIRVAHAADLPPTDKLVRDLLNNPPLEGGSKGDSRVSANGPSGRGPVASGSALRAPQPAAMPQGAPTVSKLEDIVALAVANNAPILKVQIENNIHLVRLEPGLLEFRPAATAPRTLAGDLQQKLNQWTGQRWNISIAREGGAPTLAEQKREARAARMESVAQEPMVRAVLDRFPGAEITAVRDVVAEDIAAAMPDESDA
jgi:DNA polymerase-3 subunit gamma/tau